MRRSRRLWTAHDRARFELSVDLVLLEVFGQRNLPDDVAIRMAERREAQLEGNLNLTFLKRWARTQTMEAEAG